MSASRTSQTRMSWQMSALRR